MRRWIPLVVSVGCGSGAATPDAHTGPYSVACEMTGNLEASCSSSSGGIEFSVALFGDYHGLNYAADWYVRAVAAGPQGVRLVNPRTNSQYEGSIACPANELCTVGYFVGTQYPPTTAPATLLVDGVEPYRP